MSQGDGPPINLTCIGVSVPATVHVYAMTAGTAAGAAVIPAPGSTTRPAAVAQADGGPFPLDSRYLWDFGDPDGRWNVLPGWNAAHIYDKPGRYTITLTVTDAAGHATHRTTWVRIAPDDRRRVYVSSNGNDALTGASPASAVQSVGRALRIGQSDAVICFRRGDTFDVSRSLTLKGQNVRLTAYDAPMTAAPRKSEGPPADPSSRIGQAAAAEAKALEARQADAMARYGAPLMPILRKVAGPAKQSSIIIIDAGSRDIMVDSIEFDSEWPFFSEFGTAKVPARAFGVGGSNITFRDCSFRNLTDAINTELRPVGVLVQDSHFSQEIRGYGVFGNGSDHVYVGNVMTNSCQEHLIRCSEPGITRLLIAHNDLSRPNNGKGSIELRNANWFYVAGNHITGGTMRVGPQAVDQGQFPHWREVKCTWGVVEDNRLDRIFLNVRLGTEHVVYRNNIIRQDGSGQTWAMIVECRLQGFDEVRKIIDLRIERNTAINPGVKGQFVLVGGAPVSLSVLRNLYVAPNLGAKRSADPSADGPGSGQASCLFSFEPTLEGFKRVEGNVWPDGPGGVQHFGKADHDRAEWVTLPFVKADTFQNVTLDAEDNPPADVAAGARLPGDHAQHDLAMKQAAAMNAAAQSAGHRPHAAPSSAPSVLSPSTQPPAEIR